MKYAYCDSHDCRVLQWIDTEAMSYNLPDVAMLHECTATEWEMQNSGEMMIKAGAVIPYIAPSLDLAQLKVAKWAAIKTERDRRKSGGVKVGNKWFHSDDASRIQQVALVMLGAGIPAGLQWKTMDGSFITMTQTLATSVFGAVVASDQSIFAIAEGHRVAMETSASPATYDFSAGWPQVYADTMS